MLRGRLGGYVTVDDHHSGEGALIRHRATAICVIVMMEGASALSQTSPAKTDMSSLDVESYPASAAGDVRVLPPDGACPSKSQGRWIVVKNFNTGSRVYATIQTDSVPASYPIRDFQLAAREIATPVFSGLLLLPGEVKAVGCEAEFMTGSQTTVRFKFSIAGAYYPNPDINFPDTDNPEDFVRFYFRPGLSPSDPKGSGCVTSGTPTGYFFIHNTHPRRTLSVSVVGIVGNPSPGTFTLPPDDYEFSGCDNNHLHVTAMSFKN